jgi:hypothetical protein
MDQLVTFVDSRYVTSSKLIQEQSLIIDDNSAAEGESIISKTSPSLSELSSLCKTISSYIA